MKNVTQVLYSGLGGHGSVAFSIFEGDFQRQIRHKFVFFGIEPVKDEYMAKCRQNHIEYDAVIIKDMPKYKSLIKSFWAIRKQKPDTIILHSISLFLLVPLFRLLGIRVISVDHTPNATKPKIEWVAVKMLRWFSNVQVYLTKEQYEDNEERFGKDFYRVGHPVIINNGIDTLKFVPKNAYEFGAPFRIMMQARFSNTKDFQTIIRAVAMLKNKTLPTFHVFLAGDGETFQTCKELAKELQVDSLVTFLGMQPEKILIDYLQNSHLYIHSSLSETMSTAIMQALSCGLPCMVSDIPGNRSIIEENKNGWMFQTRNPEDLAHKVELFLTNQLPAHEMAQKARLYAEEQLSMVRMFNNYYKFI